MAGTGVAIDYYYYVLLLSTDMGVSPAQSWAPNRA